MAREINFINMKLRNYFLIFFISPRSFVVLLDPSPLFEKITAVIIIFNVKLGKINCYLRKLALFHKMGGGPRNIR